MSETHPPYSPEFRRQMVDPVRSGRDPADLARAFEPTAQAIRNWVVQADWQEGRREEKGDGLGTAEREELARLRRENKQLRVGRDILSRAAAWFAREKRPQDAPPERRTAKPSTAPCRPGVRVHEREPGHLPDRHHGPCSRRVGGGLLRLAAPFSVCSRLGRRNAVEAASNHPRPLARNPRSAARACRVAGRREEARAQAHRAPDACGRTGGREPPLGRGNHHETGQRNRPSAGFGGPGLHGNRAEPALGH